MGTVSVTRQQVDRGALATRPSELPNVAWREIASRVWTNSGTHNLGLMAAGLAFYAFLSFVPLLGAVVICYGLIADTATIAGHLDAAIRYLPVDAAILVSDILLSLVETGAGGKGVGLLVALALAIYGASRSSSALISALNVIYEERDRRGYARGTFVALILIASILGIAVLGIFSAALFASIGDLVGQFGTLIGTMLTLSGWILAGLACTTVIAAIYRFAPDRENAKWRWLSLGALMATAAWLIATLAFSFYAASWGNYKATYGSLGAVVVLQIWFYLSSWAILLGALLNAEMERQVARDTTTGPEIPMGERGAAMADMSAALGDMSAYSVPGDSERRGAS